MTQLRPGLDYALSSATTTRTELDLEVAGRLCARAQPAAGRGIAGAVWAARRDAFGAVRSDRQVHFGSRHVVCRGAAGRQEADGQASPLGGMQRSDGDGFGTAGQRTEPAALAAAMKRP